MDKIKNTSTKLNKGLNNVIKLVILILIIIAFIGFLSYTRNNNQIEHVYLQPIDVSLLSKDGTHKLSVNITLSGRAQKLDKINLESLQLVTKEAVKNLEYEKIIKENGNEYIKQFILESLIDDFGDVIEQVNLNSLLTEEY